MGGKEDSRDVGATRSSDDDPLGRRRRKAPHGGALINFRAPAAQRIRLR
jgi:hypothetical protein